MQPLRILLVDDSEEFLAAAGDFLSRDPRVAVVGRARDGAEALRLAARDRPHLVLMDLAMPRMNGHEATARLKARPAPPRVVIVTQGEEPVLPDGAGADGYIRKADFAERVGAEIDALLGGARGAAGAEDLRTRNERLASELEEKKGELGRANEELSRGAARLRLLGGALDASANAVMITGVDGRIQAINRAFTALTGYSEAEALGRNPRELIHSGVHDKAFFAPMWEAILAGRVWRGELVNRRKDGGRYDEEMTITPLRDERGEIAQFVAIKLDISERKRTEEALRVSERRFRQLAENMSEVFWVSTADFREVLYVSPAYETMWGRPVAELRANPMSWAEAIHPEDRAATFDTQRVAINAGESFSTEYRIVRPDGAIRWIHARGNPIRDDAGAIYRFAGVAEDVTERRALAEQLRQVQKMDALGRLAGGVAHDFNNLLTVISGYAQFALERLPEGGEPRTAVAEIERAADRASRLTRQLLDFSRGMPARPERIDLNAVVREAIALLRRLIGDGISLVTELAEPAPRVEADAGQLGQVLMNLAINARDAMPDGGELRVATVREPARPAGAEEPDGPCAGHARLVVSDTGAGMDEATCNRIFEPFFTTKAAGLGTGLGLATVFGIVQQAGGRIKVRSAPQRGTTFEIRLPLVEE